MKLNKKGFSLAELLIAMGIVSVVATLGFTIAKRGIEDAYDLYVYTGYNGIATAIGHAQGRNILVTENEAEFFNDIRKTLGASGSGGSINAPNGINYTFTKTVGTHYSLKMEVPSVKKNGKSRNTICLNYAPEEDWGILVPLDTGGCKSTIENVRKRADLLPFYVDDGEVGRRLPQNNMEYKPRTIVSAETAICTSLKDFLEGGKLKVSDGNLNCTGVPQKGESKGKIRLTHPRKAG